MPFNKQDIETFIKADTLQEVNLTDDQVNQFNIEYRNSDGDTYDGDEFHEFVVSHVQTFLMLD